MEHSPQNQSEADEAKAAAAETDDDDEEQEDKKTATRHVPLVRVEKPKPAEEEEKPRPKVSITNRLLESIGAKPIDKVEDQSDEHTKEAEEDTAQPDEREWGAFNVEDEQEQSAPETSEEASVTAEEQAPEPVAATMTEQEQPTAAPLEAASWEPETVEGEPGSSVIELHSSGDVEPEAGEEVFADIPPAPEVEGMEPEVETGPVEPELLAEGLGSEGPPEPPEDTSEAAPAGDEEPTPAFGGGGGGGGAPGGGGERPWYDAAAADRERAHQRELDEAEYQGRRTGTRHGLAAGLFFGWMLGRHGKKKQAKGFEKAIGHKDKEIKQLKTEHILANERIAAIQRTQEQLRSNITEKTTVAAQPEVVPIEKPVETKVVYKQIQPERVPKVPRNIADITVVKVMEREQKPRPQQVEVVPFMKMVTEKRPSTAEREPEKAPEKAPENQPITEETYEVAEGRRVETSAWHRIEVDEKTGKAVSDPEVAYGEEFRHEQRQEVFTEDPVQTDAGVKKKRTAAAAESVPHQAAQIGGLAAASYAAEDTTYRARQTTSGLASSPVSPVQEEQRKNNATVLHYMSMPIVWVLVVLVIAIIFVFSMLR